MWYALEFMANWIGKIRLKQMGFGDIPWVVKQTQTEILGLGAEI